MELSQCLKGVRLAINISWVLLAGVLISQIIWLLAQCQPMEKHWYELRSFSSPVTYYREIDGN